MIIFLSIYILTINSASVDNLLVKENMLSKQLILSGEAQCDKLQADRIVTEELDISTEFSSDILQLNSMSPIRTGTKGGVFIETDINEDVIYISGNPEFKQSIIMDEEGEEKREKVIEAEFVEIHGQSQWIQIALDTFSDGSDWNVVKKHNENDNDKLRQTLKQNNFYNYNHEHFKRSQLDEFRFDQFKEILSAKQNEELVFQYNQLPDSHTYLQIQFNYYVLTDLWRQGSQIYLKIDGQLVWIQQHQQQMHALCLYVDHLLQNLEKQSLIQDEFDKMQQMYWQIPVNLAVKHIRHKVHIEIGMHLGVYQQFYYIQIEIIAVMLLRIQTALLGTRKQILYVWCR